MAAARRPRAIDELQAASAVGQGKLYQVYDELLRARGVPTRPGAADVLRHQRPHALPQRPPDAAQAARVARRPGDQRERHDDDRRDLVRQQRLPGRAGGDPARRRAAAAADRRRRRVSRPTPHHDPERSWSPRSTTSTELEALDIGHTTSPLGLRRDALEGRGRRDGHRRRDPDGDRQRAATPARSPRPPPASRVGTAFPAAGGPLLELQAVAEVRQAGPRAGSSSTPAPRGRCATAARACCRSESSTSPASSTPATRSRSRTTTRPSARGSATTRPPSCARSAGLQSAAVRALLPRASEEAVHRDYFVLA